MSGRHKKSQREKDITGRFLRGDLDEDRLDSQHRFSQRSARAEQRKIERTALLRLAEQEPSENVDQLPIGQVVQVYSLYYDVEYQGVLRLCVVRKTLARLQETAIIVGDLVRFRETGTTDEHSRPEAVIEEVLDRKTVLTRANSHNPADQDPIVANAQQMLIVASLLEPNVKWGLVDRMIVAARSGGLVPIVCLNKIDLRDRGVSANDAYEAAQPILRHYESLGVVTLQTSATAVAGVDQLRELLRGKDTVLAGHSGVGKSTLIRDLQPTLDIRIGEISGYTGKGRHTTTSSRIYDLDVGGHVIDTPGVKLFGLWSVTPENLVEFFPDVESDTAPEWRRESYQRILESLSAG